MRPKTLRTSKVLHFHRKIPPNLRFERLEMDPLSACFKIFEDDTVYTFSLVFPALSLHDPCRRNGSFPYEVTSDELAIVERYVDAAQAVAKDEYRTWKGLTPTERISLLLTWGEDHLKQLEDDLKEVVQHGEPRRHAELILLLAKDIEVLNLHLNGLELAEHAFD